MDYKILFSKTAKKSLSKIHPKEVKNILQKIFSILGNNPFPKGKNPKKLTEMSGFRFRVGDCRVLYEIDEDQISIF